jgi:aldose 1-epimerase
MHDGTEVRLVTIENASGTSVGVINYGGVIVSIKTPDRKGRIDEITLGYDSLEEYLSTGNPAYFGATVGRFANRIAGGAFDLDGQHYALARNESGSHHLHGGVEGFDKRVWKLRELGEDDSAAVELSYRSDDGEEGYPGNLDVVARYELDEASRLTMYFEARSDKATPVNIVNHAYYNLGGAGSGQILDHELTLNAEHYVDVDEALMPTGSLARVEGTPYDFRSPHAVGERIDATPGGYDHCFVVAGPAGTLRQAARVYEAASGREMRVQTTQPGMQFYSGNFLERAPSRPVSGGAHHAIHDGLCLETEHYPDSPNQPSFPSPILRPGEAYAQTTVHTFSVR